MLPALVGQIKPHGGVNSSQGFALPLCLQWQRVCVVVTCFHAYLFIDFGLWRGMNGPYLLCFCLSLMPCYMYWVCRSGTVVEQSHTGKWAAVVAVGGGLFQETNEKPQGGCGRSHQKGFGAEHFRAPLTLHAPPSFNFGPRERFFVCLFVLSN